MAQDIADLARLASGFGGSGLLGTVAIPIAAVGATLVIGVIWSWWQAQRDAGYREAENERIVAATHTSADTVERLKQSSRVVTAENRKKDARIKTLTERLAKTKAETKPGGVCPAGCVLPASPINSSKPDKMKKFTLSPRSPSLSPPAGPSRRPSSSA